MLKLVLIILVCVSCSSSKSVKEPKGMNAVEADRQQARENIAPQEMPAAEYPAPGTIVTPPVGTPP